MIKQNIRWRLPGDKWTNNGHVWERNASNAILMAFLGAFIGSLVPLIYLMKQVSPPDFIHHVIWFYLSHFWSLSKLGDLLHFKPYLDYSNLLMANADKLGPIYLTAYAGAIITSIVFAFIGATPIAPTTHVRGRKLIADAVRKMAFWEMFRITNIENKANKNYYLPMLSSVGLDPFKPWTYMQFLPKGLVDKLLHSLKGFFSTVNQIIWFCVDRLNSHVLVFGGTGSGKSQLIKRMMHMLHRMQVLFMKNFAGKLTEEEQLEFDSLTTRPYTYGELLLINIGKCFPKALSDNLVLIFGTGIVPKIFKFILGEKLAKSLGEFFQCFIGFKRPTNRRFPTIPKMVVFGVKPEYAQELPKKYCYYFGAHDLESSRWAAPKDLRTKPDAEQFFKGWVSVDPKAKVWGLSTINVGASGIVYNQVMNGEDWTLGTLAWYYFQSVDFKKDFVSKHYLEVWDTFNSPGESLNSIMMTFGSEVTPTIVKLADIYCGFYEKMDIAQTTTVLLRREHNIDYMSSALFPTEKTKALADGSIEKTEIPENLQPQLLIKGLVRALNKKFPLPEQLYTTGKNGKNKRPIPIDRQKHRWSWYELVKLIESKASVYFPLAMENLTEQEKEQFGTGLEPFFMKELKKLFSKSGHSAFSEFYQRLDNEFSILTKKENLAQLEKFVKPENLDKLAELTEDYTKEYRKTIHKFFINGSLPILKKWRIWEYFEKDIPEKFGEVSLRDWLKNPMPEKPILIFQSSGQFPDLNNGIIRGMTAFMAGFIDSEHFPDNNKLTPDKQNDIWFFGDEFPFFGDMKIVIEPILTRGRSKGVKLVMAGQDLTQFNILYGEDFVKFICSNCGSTFVAGVQMGETADKISSTIGKMAYMRTHTTNSQGNPASSTEQQHNDEFVMTPDEVVNELGVREVNGQLMTRTLYLGARYFTDAYIFYSPVVFYPQVHNFKPARWTEGLSWPEKEVDIEKLLKNSQEDIIELKKEPEKIQEANVHPDRTNEPVFTSGRTDNFKLENPAFEDLFDEEESEYSNEDQEALAKQEQADYEKAKATLQQIQDNTPDIPLLLAEEDLAEEVIAEKLIEEICGHEVGMAKITLELLDSFMMSKQFKLKPEEKRIILKYMERKNPEGPATGLTLKPRKSIDDFYKETE